MDRPSLVRLHIADGRTFCSGVVYKGGVLTVAHANSFVGMKVTCEGETREVVSVRKLNIAKISVENQNGDMSFLGLNKPFSSMVREAKLGAATKRLWVTHKDNAVSPRKMASRWGYITAGFPTDYFNRRWLWLSYVDVNDRPLVGGDSGGPILNDKNELVGLVSRVDFGCGPNLTHRDVRKVLP